MPFKTEAICLFSSAKQLIDLFGLCAATKTGGIRKTEAKVEESDFPFGTWCGVSQQGDVGRLE